MKILFGRPEHLALLLAFLLLFCGAAQTQGTRVSSDDQHQRQKRALSNGRNIKNEVHAAGRKGRKPHHKLSNIENMESVLKELSYKLQDISKTLQTEPPAPLSTEVRAIQKTAKKTNSEVAGPTFQTSTLPAHGNITQEEEFRLFNSSLDDYFIHKLEQMFPYIYVDAQTNNYEGLNTNVEIVTEGIPQTTTLPGRSDLLLHIDSFESRNMAKKQGTITIESSGSTIVPFLQFDQILQKLKNTMDHITMSKHDSLLHDLDGHFDAAKGLFFQPRTTKGINYEQEWSQLMNVENLWRLQNEKAPEKVPQSLKKQEELSAIQRKLASLESSILPPPSSVISQHMVDTRKLMPKSKGKSESSLKTEEIQHATSENSTTPHLRTAARALPVLPVIKERKAKKAQSAVVRKDAVTGNKKAIKVRKLKKTHAVFVTKGAAEENKTAIKVRKLQNTYAVFVSKGATKDNKTAIKVQKLKKAHAVFVRKGAAEENKTDIKVQKVPKKYGVVIKKDAAEDDNEAIEARKIGKPSIVAFRKGAAKENKAVIESEETEIRGIINDVLITCVALVLTILAVLVVISIFCSLSTRMKMAPVIANMYNINKEGTDMDYMRIPLMAGSKYKEVVSKSENQTSSTNQNYPNTPAGSQVLNTIDMQVPSQQNFAAPILYLSPRSSRDKSSQSSSEEEARDRSRRHGHKHSAHGHKIHDHSKHRIRLKSKEVKKQKHLPHSHWHGHGHSSLSSTDDNSATAASISSTTSTRTSSTGSSYESSNRTSHTALKGSSTRSSTGSSKRFYRPEQTDCCKLAFQDASSSPALEKGKMLSRNVVRGVPPGDLL